MSEALLTQHNLLVTVRPILVVMLRTNKNSKKTCILIKTFKYICYSNANFLKLLRHSDKYCFITFFRLVNIRKILLYLLITQ